MEPQADTFIVYIDFIMAAFYPLKEVVIHKMATNDMDTIITIY